MKAMPKENETQNTSFTSALTPSEKILLKEQQKAQKNAVSLTPSEKILARERALRELAPIDPQDVASGKAYRKVDTEGGVLTDPSEIVLYKHTQQKDLFVNGLLGQYDEEGNYFISEEIRRELVALNKTCGESFEDTYYAISRNEEDPYHSIKFALSIEKDEDGTNTATLKVLEEVERNGGLIHNTMSTFVAQLSDTDSEEFTTLAFETFHIIRITDTQSNFMVEDLAPVTMKRKRNLKATFEGILKGMSKEEQALLKKRLNMLDGSTQENAKELLSKLNEMMTQVEKYQPERLHRRGRPFVANNIFENLIGDLFPNLASQFVESLIPYNQSFGIKLEQALQRTQSTAQFEQAQFESLNREPQQQPLEKPAPMPAPQKPPRTHDKGRSQ